MFTGIVEELGEVVRLDPLDSAARLVVRASVVGDDVTHGASIAVNGVCLTAVEWQSGEGSTDISFDVMQESLDRSSLARLAPGSRVNLERAVTPQTRLGGHIVQGHVDGVGTLLSRVAEEHWDVVRVSLPAELRRYVVAKGSITVDGISLTVSGLGDAWFEVSLIPTTRELTTLGHKQPDDLVNLEVDVIAKYVEQLVRGASA